MGKAALAAIETLNGFCPNVIPERLPLLVPRPNVVPLIYGNAEPLPVLEELPNGYGACFHGNSLERLATLLKRSAFVHRVPLPRSWIKVLRSLEHVRRQT